jgi:hypothetical protein
VRNPIYDPNASYGHRISPQLRRARCSAKVQRRRTPRRHELDLLLKQKCRLIKPSSQCESRETSHKSASRKFFFGTALAGLVASNGAVFTDGIRGRFLERNPKPLLKVIWSLGLLSIATTRRYLANSLSRSIVHVGSTGALLVHYNLQMRLSRCK